MKKWHATLLGGVAILMWSTLAPLTTIVSELPPLQITATTFGVSAAIGISRLFLRPEKLRHFRQPVRVWLLGAGGLFGYHFLYFLALQSAPPVEASLIAYLWPLLIVLLSAMLPGEVLLPRHVFGAMLGFAGAALIVTGGASVLLKVEYLFGYAVAFCAALTWSGYSVLSRHFAGVSSEVVTGYCVITAVLAAFAHQGLEQTVWPGDSVEWLALIALGIGPVGIAFFTWDIATKRGHIRALAAMSYAAPLVSTLILFAMGLAEPGVTIPVACALIVIGAAICSWERRPNRKFDAVEKVVGTCGHAAE